MAALNRMATESRRPLSNTEMETIVAQTTTLVSLPAVCVKINEIIERNNYTVAEIGSMISKDANLAARLLRVANSAFYGFPSKINTVSRAVTIIGSRELRDIVLATSAVEAFSKIPIDMANMNSFWMHSLDCAIIARIIASRAHVLHNERLFVTGLLHDVGHLVMVLKIPDYARDAMVHAARKQQNIEQAEQEIIGFDHAQIGAALLKAWQLPDNMYETVQYHHDPFAAPNYARDAAIVYLANQMAKAGRMGSNIPAPSVTEARVMEELKLTVNDTTLIMEEAKRQFAEALSIFLPHLAEAR